MNDAIRKARRHAYHAELLARFASKHALEYQETEEMEHGTTAQLLALDAADEMRAVRRLLARHQAATK